MTTNPGPSGAAGAPPDLLRIDSIVAGGDGIARRDDGCVVFVARTAPGELVEVEYTDVRRQWARARVVGVREASESRRDPPCPHYGRCGGCQLQHLEYDAQRSVKGAVVAESLRRIGGIDAAPPEVVASPRELGYRNRVTLIARRDGALVGYHDTEDPTRLVDVERCPLAEEPINGVLAALRRAWRESKEYFPRGRELRLTLRATVDGDVGLALEGGRDVGRPEALLAAVAGLGSVWVLNRRGDVVRSAGAKTLDERWGPYSIPVAGVGFVQVNRDASSLLDDHVRDLCGDVAGRRVVDAYCGFGVRALDLARRGAAVVGIERDRHAVKWAARSAGAVSEGGSPRFIANDVERALAGELPADVVVLNPPRRGVALDALHALRRRGAGRVVYVSCDPATLARDLKELSPTFGLVSLRAFDLFPQTAHVETVAALETDHSGP
jgi:23S rRNA (uracil1939-C5)-methyltransferase